MPLELILKGLLIGLILGMPTGPVSILCLRRTIVSGRLAGLVSCVGACLADSVYVVAVQVGMEQVAQFIHRQTLCLHILAAVFIVTVGSRIIVRSPKFRDEGRDHHKGLLSSAFLLSVTNPVMLISLPALF